MKNITPGWKAGGAASANGPAKPSTHQSGQSKWTAPSLIEKPFDAASVKSTLTGKQAEELSRLEKIVTDGWDTFLAVGHALVQIRDQELFRDKYSTFQEYYRLQFGLSKTYAYNLIRSAEVYDDLSSIEDFRIKPVNEAQTRCLISVPKEKRVSVWKKVVKDAGGKPITAGLVRSVAAEFSTKTTAKKTKTVTKPATPKLDLSRALKLVDEIVKFAGEKIALAKKVRELRKCLEALAGEQL